MAQSSRKIINDPVYGFITIDHPLIFQIIAHPFYQRLRRIHQMAMASLVYPGAVHTRLHHSLGAYHLMCNALTELKSKSIEITDEEVLAAKIAILLHDVGHGPYSHALEHTLIEGVHHESMSLLIMQQLNKSFGGRLTMAIDIFKNNYHKPFLHQLVSGQLDVDRMDYLTRDSFFTGVSEGVIGYDRILKMLAVHQGNLMVEEKAIYTIEKFLVSRRLMYWQVYLHKTVLAAEKMLVKIIERAKELTAKGEQVQSTSIPLNYFLQNSFIKQHPQNILEQFCMVDDYDVLATIKNWCNHNDKVLNELCCRLMNRKLLKVKFSSTPVEYIVINELRNRVCEQLNISLAEAEYFVFTGEAVNTTYDPYDERINILFKDGTVKDISKVDNALIQHNLSSPVKKYYICHLA
jgi:uncharacterized protein